MDQFKQAKWFTRLAAIVLTGTLLVSCGNSETKTTETKSDTTTTTVAPSVQSPVKDSLPPVDTSASGRPDGIKTR